MHKFVISDSKSLQLILKFRENGFFRILIVNLNLSDVFTYRILIDTHQLGGTFPVHLRIYTLSVSGQNQTECYQNL